ncbi:MAG: Uma2 family endonuclease [Fimbriimonadales bacterium]|nr:Uma2 family endonuclease [Fimbriimonadales bacterium]
MSAPAVLTQPTAEEPAAPHLALQRLRFTPEQFHRLGELGFFDDDQKYELLEGDIYPMPPEGPEHSTERTRLMYRFVSRQTRDWHVRIEAPLRLNDSEPIPDIAIVPGRVEDYESQHPTTALLVIEIAQTSLPRDRTQKLALYAQAGVPEYWIVNLQDRRLEVYREPAGREYKAIRYYTQDETVAPLFDPAWSIPVAELFGGG